MSRIVTLSDGTRCRVVGKVPQRGNTVVYWDGTEMRCREATEADLQDPGLQDDLLEELPRVPDWPKLGPPPPQYLYHGQDIEIKDGDTWVFKDAVPGQWSIQEDCRGGGCMMERPGGQIDAWLISRKDPTEDIDHDN